MFQSPLLFVEKFYKNISINQCINNYIPCQYEHCSIGIKLISDREIYDSNFSILQIVKKKKKS